MATQPSAGPGVSLRWQAPDTGPVTGYNVYRGTSPYALSLLASTGNTTTFSDTSANPQLYYYTVRAFNAAGEGPASNLTGMVGRALTSMSAMSSYGQLERRTLSWSVHP